MTRKSPRPPSYRLHRPTGQAVVTLNGRDLYLGPHSTPDSRAAYDRTVAEWLAAGRQLPPRLRGRQDDAGVVTGVTVSELVNRFRSYAENYYRDPEGNSTSELASYRFACRPLVRLYGNTPAADFGPKRLKVLREAMVGIGWSRKQVNKQVMRVRRVFGWGVEEELVPGGVEHALRSVRGLKYGRSDARETAPVKAVPAETVRQTLPAMTPTLRDMVVLQMLVGCRPGELCDMTTGEIDRTGDVWMYRPVRHKTRHHGHARTIRIGPDARAILAPRLNLADPDAPLFSPVHSEAERQATRHAGRVTRMSCGNVPGSRGKGKRRRGPLDRFVTGTYAKAIRNACRRAFPSAAADKLAALAADHKRRHGVGIAEARVIVAAERPDLVCRVAEERNAARWTPNQLRHRSATDLRERFDIDVAQTILGHRLGSAVTEIYAEANAAKADAAVRLVG